LIPCVAASSIAFQFHSSRSTFWRKQLVASVAAEEWTEDELFGMVGDAYPYRNLERKDFDEVITNAG